MRQKTLFSPDLTLEEAEELIKNGANVHEKDEAGQTPLFYIMNSHILKNIEIAKLFIAHGADVDAKNQYGCTPLFYADQEEMIQLLIVHGAEVNMLDNDLDSPLHSSELKKTRLLISHGAKINLINLDGKTPLDVALNIRVARYLIKNGAIYGKIKNYQQYSDLFTKKQKDMFDTFASITGLDKDFYQMCLAYQEGIKNHVKIEIKDMDIV